MSRQHYIHEKEGYVNIRYECNEKKSDAKILGLELTEGEKCRNQFHNELRLMKYFSDQDLAPKIKSVIKEQLSYDYEFQHTVHTKQNVHEEHYEALIDTIVKFHNLCNKIPFKLRDIDHSLYPEEKFFDSAQHNGGPSKRVKFIFEEKSQILSIASRLGKRIIHGDLNSKNILYTKSGIIIIDFELAHYGFRATELVLFAIDLKPISEPGLTFEGHLELLDRYNRKADSKISTLEFLYAIIRKHLWALRKINVEEPAADYKIDLISRSFNLLQTRI
jgi:thiamine kinase-like enzyme